MKYKLKDLIDNLEITMTELGRRGNMSGPTIVNIRNGRAGRRSTVNRLLRVLSEIHGVKLTLENVEGIIIQGETNVVLEQQEQIDTKWDEIIAEAIADEASGNLIPGGFGGPCEFSDELEGMLKELIRMAHQGMTECEQQHVSNWIINALADIELERKQSV